MDIGRNISEIKNALPEGVRLVAVTKTKPPEIIEEAYISGHKIFGENKVQELVQKYEKMPKDIEWHFIGHLQSNKAKYIVPFVSMIHGIDSFKILQAVNNEAARHDRTIPCLLQFHIARESTKFGLSREEAIDILESGALSEMKNIRIAGVMGMATFTDDTVMVRGEFRMLREIFEELKRNYFTEDPLFKEISMGMSDDYNIAVEEGSTIVRIGSIIFGSR
jgi:pyridoxal phosphate enzyme (YggS family)